jgi:tetratricopeptide (TPR) repeat protein
MSVDAPTVQMETTEAGERSAASRSSGDGRELVRGTRFGRFIVTAPLGSGGAGAVYAAYDPELDRRVALKVLHTDEVDRPEWPRLVREARALARLSHPNVVVVHDVGLEGGRAFLATELVDGTDLRRWLRERPELPSAAVLELFVAAGRGLAAAHGAGMIHGDFKPANVLVGTDGRPRVADFGLARIHRAPATSGSNAVLDSDEVERQPARESQLFGTPYYMAPEQFDGMPADERADQYAFCLALLEALVDRRIFANNSVSSLMVLKQAAIAEPTFDRVRPRWLAKLLARGLDPDPAKRHPSMTALLDAIANAQRASSRRRLAFGLGGALVLGAAATYGAVAPGIAAPCTGSARHIEALWSSARASEIGSAFAAAHPSLGASSWPRIATALEEFGARWIAGHRTACLAAHHREEPAETTAARTRCLDDRRARLGALLEVFADADTQTVLGADAAVRALPPVATCADVDTVLAAFGPAPGDDPEAVALLDTELRRVDVALELARVELARRGLDAAVAIADERGLQHAADAIGVRRGMLLHLTGDFAEAQRVLEAAVLDAVAQGDDRTALSGLAPLVRTAGSAQLRFDDARAWARWGEPLATRVDAPASVRADLLSAIARVEGIAHDDAAIDHLERAIALLEADDTASAVPIALLQIELGDALRARGDVEAAIARIGDARDIIEGELGPLHPDHIAATGALGLVLWQRGDASGRALIEQALADSRAVYGIDHPALAPALNNLAGVEMDAGRYERTRALLLESLALERRRFGEDHLVTAPTLVNLATAALWMDQPALAIGELDHAERILVADDADRPELAGVYRQRSYALASLGRAAEAVATGVRAVEAFDRHRARTDPARADARVQLGWARTLAGDLEGAKVAYDEAIAILDRPDAEMNPPLRAAMAEALRGRADVHAAAGRAAAAAADRERAQALSPGP